MEERRLSDFIDIAIQREIEAYEFSGPGDTVGHDGARDALDLLAGGETQHRNFLEDYQAGRLGPETLRLTQVIDYKIAEHLEKPDLHQNLDSRDVYLVAAHREQNASTSIPVWQPSIPTGRSRTCSCAWPTKNNGIRKRWSISLQHRFPQTDGG